MSRALSNQATVTRGGRHLKHINEANQIDNVIITHINNNNNDNIVSNGTVAMTSNLDLGTNKIINVSDCTLAQDSATKNYVDTNFIATGSDILIDHPNELKYNNNNSTNRKIVLHEIADNLHQYTGVTSFYDTVNTNLKFQVESPASSIYFMFGQSDTSSASRFTITDAKVYSNVELSVVDKCSITNGVDECSIEVVSDGHMKFYRDSTIKMSLSSIQNVMYQEINMNSNKISSVSDPTDAQDVATKSYSDTKLPLSGGTISDGLAIEKNVTGDFIALKLTNLSQSYSATKVVFRMEENRPAASFVQLELNDGGNFACNVNGNYMWYSGTSLTKFYTYIDLNSQKIQSLADPTIGTDGANKQYVDNLTTKILASSHFIKSDVGGHSWSALEGRQLMNNICIRYSQTSNITDTLPTAANLIGTYGFPSDVDNKHYSEFTYINNDNTYTVTINNSTPTLAYGDLVVQPLTSAKFRVMFASPTTYNLYRMS
jgi:hypothetical protein